MYTAGQVRFRCVAAGQLKLITENYVLPGRDVLLSFGPRSFGERLSADVGLLLPITDGSLDVALPLVNFVWNW
jgi:hypothetical protein